MSAIEKLFLSSPDLIFTCYLVAQIFYLPWNAQQNVFLYELV